MGECQKTLHGGPWRHRSLVDEALERFVVGSLTRAFERLQEQKLEPVGGTLLAGLPADDRHLGNA